MGFPNMLRRLLSLNNPPTSASDAFPASVPPINHTNSNNSINIIGGSNVNNNAHRHHHQRRFIFRRSDHYHHHTHQANSTSSKGNTNNSTTSNNNNNNNNNNRKFFRPFFNPLRKYRYSNSTNASINHNSIDQQQQQQQQAQPRYYYLRRRQSHPSQQQHSTTFNYQQQKKNKQQRQIISQFSSTKNNNHPQQLEQPEQQQINHNGNGKNSSHTPTSSAAMSQEIAVIAVYRDRVLLHTNNLNRLWRQFDEMITFKNSPKNNNSSKSNQSSSSLPSSTATNLKNNNSNNNNSNNNNNNSTTTTTTNTTTTTTTTTISNNNTNSNNNNSNSNNINNNDNITMDIRHHRLEAKRALESYFAARGSRSLSDLPAYATRILDVTDERLFKIDDKFEHDMKSFEQITLHVSKKFQNILNSDTNTSNDDDNNLTSLDMKLHIKNDIHQIIKEIEVYENKWFILMVNETKNRLSKSIQVVKQILDIIEEEEQQQKQVEEEDQFQSTNQTTTITTKTTTTMTMMTTTETETSLPVVNGKNLVESSHKNKNNTDEEDFVHNNFDDPHDKFTNIRRKFGPHKYFSGFNKKSGNHHCDDLNINNNVNEFDIVDEKSDSRNGSSSRIISTYQNEDLVKTEIMETNNSKSPPHNNNINTDDGIVEQQQQNGGEHEYGNDDYSLASIGNERPLRQRRFISNPPATSIDQQTPPNSSNNNNINNNYTCNSPTKRAAFNGSGLKSVSLSASASASVSAMTSTLPSGSSSTKLSASSSSAAGLRKTNNNNEFVEESTSATAQASSSSLIKKHEDKCNANEEENKPPQPAVEKNISFASTLYRTKNARVDAITDAGVVLRRSHVKGDGRCLFRALVRCKYISDLQIQQQQKQQQKGIRRNGTTSDINNTLLIYRLTEEQEREEADDLRLQTIEQLIIHRQLLATFFVIEGNFPEYIKNMACPGTYGGEPELLVLAKLVHVPIAVYISSDNQYRRIQVYGKQYRGEPLRLLYSDNVHYDSLLPVNSRDYE